MSVRIEAILFDLDGTLLDSDMDTFLPHYFRRLSAWVAGIVPPDTFMAHLMSATERMLTNNGPATNEEVFSSAFYPLAGHPRAEVEPLLLDFYTIEFPKLRKHTQRKPEARRVVQQAFDLGLEVVVATNPLFPATAVEQRLEWAGVFDFPYRRVTTYENSSATKPNLRYFEEILELLGQPPEASLVVGDEDMDMVAAHLGCRTFLVPGPRTELAETTPEPAHCGSLADVGALLESWA